VVAGDTITDTLLIFYGNGNDDPEGDRIESQPATNTYTLAGLSATGGTPSFAQNDNVVAHPSPRPSPCNLSVETVQAAPVVSNVTVPIGVAGMTGGALFNIGNSAAGRPPRFIAYRVKDRNLLMCDYWVNDCSSAAASNWVTVASNVVSLRAQYGQDTTPAPMDGTVDAYNQTTPTTMCTWVRMRAVRLALVARSAQLEKLNSDGSHVTPNAPTWAGTSSTPSIAVDLSGDTSWQDYRYKVFETVVPLRNVAWLGVQTGC
jgi:type IV pilus assembly protein PilW